MISEQKLKDFRQKIKSLRKIIGDKQAKGLIINNQNHFSWLTGGRGFIGLASTAACGSLIITLDKVYLVADNIEVNRLYREQCGENPDIILKEYPWQSPREKVEIINEICGKEDILDEGSVSSELFQLRTVLSDYDIERYRDICKTTAVILEGICYNLKQGITEYELAGEISKKMWSSDLEPITILVAFDERALSYRHPVPVGKELENYALIAVCTRRDGLIASATRMVALKHPGEEMLRRQRAAAYVDATFLANTTPGRNIGEIFEKAMNAYKEEGFEGEWKLHHQGGITGYVPRELKGMSDVDHIVRANETYGWNPTVQGTKVENTILITKSGYENLTHTGNYKYIPIEIDGKTHLEEDILILR